MAIPDNYIDKITKGNDSRMISPAAGMVRVNNDNFDGETLDEVLDDVAQAISEAGEVKSVSVNNGTPSQPDAQGNVNLTVDTGGDNDIVDLSDGTANDGAVVFTKRNGDTITLDLNHAHPQYQPLLTAGANITIATNQQTGDLEISASGGGSGGVQSSDVATIVKLADQASYEALPTKDSSTLYLIPES